MFEIDSIKSGGESYGWKCEDVCAKSSEPV